ncbi:hypothetical protein ACTXI9_01720 [Brachybacterium alimentarium]|uniref:hypothetical protein n=1 Tax=Brachybacterium alimentarium TaxID=47845 RepID=UPI003FCF3AAA
MTTDAFTTAARAEGQSRIAAMVESAGASADIRAWFPVGFEKGAEWARDHLAAQEPTDAEVEAAANAILALVPGETEETAHMDDIDDAWDHARAALTAARKARA